MDLLLTARQRVPGWLSEPLLALAPIVEPPAHSLPRMEGHQLGGYTLVREIGRGGMGYLGSAASRTGRPLIPC